MIEERRKAPMKRGYTIFPSQTLDEPGTHGFPYSGPKGWTKLDVAVGMLVSHFGPGAGEMYFTPAAFSVSITRNPDGSVSFTIVQDFDAFPPP
ncbi:hypothetical protein [Bradyrhizobium arachidis]|uniref:Uncharacterized protein n=1 Tax=Bradyrhizobium arachidis TaxID=858423 RepID=A0AAE7NML0_9BRAD|nr:hypothetical protein [Bradyrhizobium arachidis]QOZ66935.1 hypothetical protein WN72_11890 [Bradyrhizobium arachidis]SFV13812.1 hypothetical protein SAMN05192541_120121 [Bradyrhizobium arachidis]